MSHLATQLGYSAGEFQALQLIVLATFGVVDNHLPPACWSTFWKSIFKRQLGCRFDIMDSISSFCVYFDICNYICLDTSYHFLALSSLLKYSYFFKYSCTNIFHRRSLCTFYSNRTRQHNLTYHPCCSLVLIMQVLSFLNVAASSYSRFKRSNFS